MPNFGETQFSRDYQIKSMYGYLVACLKQNGGEIVIKNDELFDTIVRGEMKIAVEENKMNDTIRLFIPGYKEEDTYEKLILNG